MIYVDAKDVRAEIGQGVPHQLATRVGTVGIRQIMTTLPETNSSPMKITTFPGKDHENGGFSWAMLVSDSFREGNKNTKKNITQCQDKNGSFNATHFLGADQTIRNVWSIYLHLGSLGPG